MRKQTYTRENVFLVFAALAALVMLSAFIAMNIRVADRLGRGGDFLINWKGARAFLYENTELYGLGPAGYVQRQVYGRAAVEGEKPYILEMPFHLLLLYFPAALAEEPGVPLGIFMFLSEAALLALIFFSIQLTDWQPRWLFTISLFLFSALSLYSVWALMEASPMILLGLLYSGILLALRAEMDELAGALIILAAYKWEAGVLFLALVLLRVVAQRRWRVLSGAFMLLFVLLVISFFVYGNWLIPHLRAALADAKWQYGYSLKRILAEIWPQYGARAAPILAALLGIIVATEWTWGRTAEFRRFYWAACLSLAVTPLLVWHSELQNLVVLILPLTLILSVVRERWRAGYWLSGLLLVLIFGIPWALLLGGFVEPGLGEEMAYLFMPVFTVVGLYWTKWWSMRPARTWLERAGAGEYK